MLAEARAEVGTADAKASLLLAALGVGFGALVGGLLASDWSPAKLTTIGEVVWWFGAVAAATSIGFAAAAVWPRYVRTDVSAGVHYWGHVATFCRLQDLAQALDGRPNDGGRARTRHQLWRLSRLVSLKYACVRVAIAAAGVAVVLFVVSVLI